MKRTVIICLLILISVGGTLSYMDYRGQYAAERYMWRLNKQFSKLAKDVQNNPEAHYKEIENKYRNFMKRFPDSSLFPAAHVYIGRVYILQKKYEEAREIFSEIIARYPENQEVVLIAYQEIVQSYINEGDIASALSIYKTIRDEYPLTLFGLKVPLLMAVLYADNDDPQWSNKAFESAVRYYNDLIKKYPNTPVEYHALYLLVRCYSAENNWEKTLETMRSILIQYSSEKYLDQKKAENLIKGINGIAIGKLENSDLAVDIYKDFIGQHPDHALNQTLKKLIDSIENLKTNSAELMVK